MMQAQDARSRHARPGPLGRLALLLLFVALATVVALVLPLPTVVELRAMLDDLGWWGVAAFVVGYAALTLAPVPKSVLSVSAGVLFGFSGGLLVVYAAAMLGATAAFWLGRALGREAVEKFTGTRVGRVDEVLRRRGFVAVVGVRLVPVLPFTAINYSAGLTSVGWWPYFFGTLVGIVPGALSFVALGAYGLELEWPALVAVGVLGVLTLAGAVVAVRTRRRGGGTGA
ncbi:TVP38/TMEM64 family protein [Kocuria sabuli]|uniref:TVP38/TMEM64 family protein n=1 Tax=Kocuria sabuli TaxID=3071448 RepID=UPI0034D75732